MEGIEGIEASSAAAGEVCALDVIVSVDKAVVVKGEEEEEGPGVDML